MENVGEMQRKLKEKERGGGPEGRSRSARNYATCVVRHDYVYAYIFVRPVFVQPVFVQPVFVPPVFIQLFSSNPIRLG